MASLRQIAANRANAEKSTGPKTDEGKARSRANALTHGLSGASLVLPDEESQAVAERLEAWRGRYVLETPEQEWLFRDLVVSSVRIDRCQRHESALRTHAAARASLCWDDDRRLDAEELAAALPGRPALVSRRLRRTRQGCDLLLDRWRGLGRVLEEGGEWTEAQTSLAFDLLGTPAELRDLPPWSSAGTAADLVRVETERLELLAADALDELDAFEREAAALGLEVESPRPLTLLRRYEAACLRRFDQARRLLTSSPRSPEPSPPSPEDVPIPAPSPSPAPDPLPVPSDPPAVDNWEVYQRAYERSLYARALDLADQSSDPAPSAPVSAPARPPVSAPVSRNRRSRRAAAALARGR